MNHAEWLSTDEFTYFNTSSDLRGAWAVLSNWLIIAATFAVTAYWTHPLTVVLAIIVLGGRQLGLAILMHEAGHNSLFATRRLNEWAGSWLCGYPILADRLAYARSHRVHHRTAGTEQDPDLPNYRDYPVSPERFRRKILRDITAQTGLKMLGAALFGNGRSIMLREGENANVLLPGLFMNALMLAVLSALGQPALYLLWVVAYLTTYMLVARVRQVAEHGNVGDLYSPDPRLHTRTTLANPLEKLIIGPNNVHYHLEHHFMPGVPMYKLPELHRLLKSRGFFDGFDDALISGYAAVIRRAVPALA